VSSKIFVITDPDDVEYDALRIVAVDLAPEQSYSLSEVLKTIQTNRDINLYVYSNLDDVAWLIDKSNKADYIFANPQSDDQQIVGYIASKRQSYFFGDTKITKALNKRSVLSHEHITEILRKELD
jgi:hypothetical protein